MMNYRGALQFTSVNSQRKFCSDVQTGKTIQSPEDIPIVSDIWL